MLVDWLGLEGGEKKYPRMKMNRAMQGKAQEFVTSLDREELKAGGGEKR